MLYKVFSTFIKSVEKTLVCDHLKEANEQYFYVVRFIMLFMVSLTLGKKSLNVTIQMKATEQHIQIKWNLSTEKFFHPILLLEKKDMYLSPTQFS